MALERLWLGMVTKNTSNSGTDSSIVLIINQDSTFGDSLHHTFPDTSQIDQGRGGANLYELDLTTTAAVPIDPSRLNDSSVRVGIRGPDQWKPEYIVTWGIDAKTQSVTAIGMRHEPDTKLSTNENEGNISLPIRKMRTGTDDSSIRSLLMLMTTADKTNAGTVSPIELEISVEGAIKVQFDFPDTPQRVPHRN